MSLFNGTPLDRELSAALRVVKTMSCWSTDFYCVDTSLYDLRETLLRFGVKSATTWQDLVPEWQRDNDKWTLEMKKSFIENVILGFKDTAICLYTLDIEGVRNGKLLDGLQRTTAIDEFLEDKFSIFDSISKGLGKEPLTYSRLLNSTSFINDFQTVKLRVYKFKSEAEAIEFYIQFNRNITHSEEDIRRALDSYQLLKAEGRCEEFN